MKTGEAEVVDLHIANNSDATEVIAVGVHLLRRVRRKLSKLTAISVMISHSHRQTSKAITVRKSHEPSIPPKNSDQRIFTLDFRHWY